jgi:hypothetical protein
MLCAGGIVAAIAFAKPVVKPAHSTGSAVSIMDPTPGACSGEKFCPCAPSPCTDSSGPCQYLYGFPGMQYLGRAVDVAKYHANLVDTLTLGKVLQGGGQHTGVEALLSDSFFDHTPDYAHGRFDQPMGGVKCSYVKPNTTLFPAHVGKTEASFSLSNSASSNAKQNSMHAGFDVSCGFISVSGSVSSAGAHSSSLSTFSGTAFARDVDYTLQLDPAATFRPGIIAGAGEYDGSSAARLAYTNLFKRVGLYFVSEVTTGGEYSFTTTVTKTAKADSSKYAAEFKAKVAFVSGSGGSSHSDKSDEYHTHEDSRNFAVGGDDSLRAKLMAYLPMIQNETIDTRQFQSDYGDFLASIPTNPVILEMKVEHIRERMGQMRGGALNPVVDNMRMAYDELFQNLAANRLTLLRVQYGMQYDFDSADATAQFVELPTELKSLPYDASANTGFTTQYDPAHSCPSAAGDAHARHLSRTLRYTEHCDASTNLLACDGLPWCDLLTSSNMGATTDKSLNAELWMRVTFVAGVGNDIQTIEFKPCGYGATWAVYWNEHQPYSHNRTQAAKVVGPRYADVAGGGTAQLLSDKDKDLFPCTTANHMGGFTDGTDPACCDALASDAAYMASQQVGCPLGCSNHGECAFATNGPLHCECGVGFGGINCSNVLPPPPPPKCSQASVPMKHVGIDFVGYDLENPCVPGRAYPFTGGGSFDDCHFTCQNTNGCGAFTWFNNTGWHSTACYLKTADAPKGAKVNPTAISGIIGQVQSLLQPSRQQCRPDLCSQQMMDTDLTCESMNTSCVASDVDLHRPCGDKDMIVHYIASWTECCMFCQGTSGCGAFTFRNATTPDPHNANNCWLKPASAVAYQVPYPGIIAGVVAAS